MSFLRKCKSSWFPSSVVLAMILCWYLIHLVQNTPGVEPNHDAFNEMQQDSPEVFERSPKLRIIVMTFNRSESLKRLLNSLLLADYLNDNVAMDIWIDRSAHGHVHNETLQAAKNFKFKYGIKNVYIHGEHFGVIHQWLRSWKHLSNPHEICVFLEDDLTVSPHFYRWLKTVHKAYEDDYEIVGFTLQGVGAIYSGPNALENVNVSKDHLTYLYSMPGTWGFSPKLQPWHKFIKWQEKMSADKYFIPHIPDNIASVWHSKNRKIGSLENMWSLWYSYFNLKYNNYVLYPNIQPKFQGFSFNWKEKGVNNHGHALQPSTGTLVEEWLPIFDKLPRKPPIVSTNGTVLVTDSDKRLVMGFPL